MHRRNECTYCWSELYLRLSISFNMGSYPYGLLCRAQSTKSCLATTIRLVRRRREGAFEEHTAGKWHVIALQEAIEYLQQESLTNHFYITHHAGCAVMVNKDAFALGRHLVGCFFYRRVPKMNGDSVCVEPSLSLRACWVSRKQIKVTFTKFGSTSSTSMRDWSIVFPGKTNIVDQFRGRGTRRTTTAWKEGRTVNT